MRSEKQKESDKAYSLQTREKRIATAKAWNAANKELINQRRLAKGTGRPPGRPRKPEGKGATPRQLEMMKARNAALKDTDIPKGWLQQLREQTTHCEVCGEPLSGSVHLDHKVPLLEGGKHYMDNVRYVHAKCNLSRKKRPMLGP